MPWNPLNIFSYCSHKANKAKEKNQQQQNIASYDNRRVNDAISNGCDQNNQNVVLPPNNVIPPRRGGMDASVLQPSNLIQNNIDNIEIQNQQAANFNKQNVFPPQNMTSQKEREIYKPHILQPSNLTKDKINDIEIQKQEKQNMAPVQAQRKTQLIVYKSYTWPFNNFMPAIQEDNIDIQHQQASEQSLPINSFYLKIMNIDIQKSTNSIFYTPPSSNTQLILYKAPQQNEIITPAKKKRKIQSESGREQNQLIDHCKTNKKKPFFKKTIIVGALAALSAVVYGFVVNISFYVPFLGENKKKKEL